MRRGRAPLAAEQILRVAGVDNLAPRRAAPGAQFDDVVRLEDHVEVVLDDDHGVSLVDERVEDADELLAVAEMEADRGLLEQVKVARGDAASSLPAAGAALVRHMIDHAGEDAGE